MATETVDRRAAHVRSLKVTAVASIGGVVAGVVTPLVATNATDQLGLAVFLGAVLVEQVVMRLIGVEVEDFSTKDHLYVAFMTFALWFITWTIILTTGTSIL